MSDWRIDLLGAIAETGSFATACARMDVAYRVGWGKIKEIERRLGFALLDSHTGGAEGGSTEMAQSQ